MALIWEDYLPTMTSRKKIYCDKWIHEGMLVLSLRWAAEHSVGDIAPTLSFSNPKSHQPPPMLISVFSTELGLYGILELTTCKCSTASDMPVPTNDGLTNLVSDLNTFASIVLNRQLFGNQLDGIRHLQMDVKAFLLKCVAERRLALKKANLIFEKVPDKVTKRKIRRKKSTHIEVTEH
ncbi:hypothetical protein DL98DRAFT_588703 [Cadophora sp. DSE1049]|nr:hypothetical protein DL98DRAFT_588703 [Cadophora sp. DSE1049]